jgi:regulator of protease activity HflC (stomatin/prohibitin superfamily)
MNFRESAARPVPGIPAAVLLLVIGLASAGAIFLIVRNGGASAELRLGTAVVSLLACAGLMAGLFVVHPNEAKVLTLFGTYTGTARAPGLWWANPFMMKEAVSLRVRNFETGKLKVNDARSNPVDIAAVVVWRVTDTAEAVFEVNDYVEYVHMQSESALRGLASTYPYDAHGDEDISLSTHTDIVSQTLQEALVDRLAKAGVEVLEARISHLAYAQEIAAAMLQRQQASAVVAARQTIVDGAVGMVHMALDKLHTDGIVSLDDERKASMVSNLLVVLCSDRAVTPVVNTGTLYA